MIKKTIIWESTQIFSTEYMEIFFSENSIEVSGTVIRLENNIPSKSHYTISLDPHWVVKRLHIENSYNNKELNILSNGKGDWFTENGDEILELKGAIDIDISCTPFTNSLPINRMNWSKNVPHYFEMTFINVPDLTYKKVKQRYELLDDANDKRKFNYKSGTFESIIEVDSDGLVTDYPQLFKRRF